MTFADAGSLLRTRAEHPIYAIPALSKKQVFLQPYCRPSEVHIFTVGSVKLLGVTGMKKYLLGLLLSLSAGLLTAGGRQEPELRAVNAQRRPIAVDQPDTSGGPAQLVVRFGAGRLDIAPGTRRALVSGAALYNNELFTPTVRVEGRRVTLSAGDGRLELGEFLDLWSTIKDHLNRWELELGPVPMELELELGAGSAGLKLGGVPIRRLRMSQGAADLTLDFDRPNPVEMASLTYAGGASRCTLRSLANANTSRVEVSGGGGVFYLDFSGKLRRDLRVKVEAGAGEVTLVFPEEADVEVTARTGLSLVDFRGTWNRPSERLYRHLGARADRGPRITVDAAVLAGKLRLLAGE